MGRAQLKDPFHPFLPFAPLAPFACWMLAIHGGLSRGMTGNIATTWGTLGFPDRVLTRLRQGLVSVLWPLAMGN